MTSETVPSLKDCTLRLGLDSLQQLSLKPKGSSSPPPPVICVPHRRQMQRIPWALSFSSFPVLFVVVFFSARPVPWLSLLCSFTNPRTSTRLRPPRAVDGDSLNPVKKTCETVWAGEYKKVMFKLDKKNFLWPVFSNVFELLWDLRLIISE